MSRCRAVQEQLCDVGAAWGREGEASAAPRGPLSIQQTTH